MISLLAELFLTTIVSGISRTIRGQAPDAEMVNWQEATMVYLDGPDDLSWIFQEALCERRPDQRR